MDLIFRFILLIIPSLLFGCSSAEEPTEFPEYFEELENLTVYPIDTEPTREIELTREVTFEESEEVYIEKIADIAIDNSGNVYIADGKQGRIAIHVFDRKGDYLTTMGREGKGPGEFLSISGLKIEGDRLFTYDFEQFRFTVFSLGSRTVDQVVNMQSESWRNNEELSEATPSGEYYIRTDSLFMVGFAQPPQLDNPDEERFLKYYLMDWDGRIVSDMVFEQRDFNYLTGTFHGNKIAFTEPFMRNRLIAVSPDGKIFSAWSDEFLVKVYDANGEYLRAFYYPFKKSILNKNDLINRHDKSWQDDEESLKDFKQRYQDVDFSRDWPALHSMLIDDENRLWISTITDDEENYEWWVLDEYGKLLARFKWPGQRLNRSIYMQEEKKMVKDGRFYTLETDEETGTEKLLGYRIKMN